MLLFVDGFDHYLDVGQNGTVIQKYLEAANYIIRNPTSSTFAIVDGRITGSKAMKFSVPASTNVVPSLSWQYAPTSSATKVVFGFAIKATGARMRIFRVEGGVLDLDWDASSGKLKVGNIQGAAVIILNAWYYIEVVLDITAQQIKVFANDELQLTAPMSTVPTFNGATNLQVTWGQTATQTTAGEQIIDDFYVLDNATGTRIDRLGPCSVNTRFPTFDVTKQWDIVANGASPVPTDHFAVAAQLGPLEANKPYLQSNVNGNTDEFRTNGALPNQNQIYGVGLVALARKGDLDDRKLGLKLTVSGTSDEKQIALVEANKYIQTTYEVPPGGGDWSPNAVETATFGIVTR